MNQLHVGAKWLFRFNTYLIMLFLSIFLGWFVVPIIYLAFTFLSGDLQSFSILGTILTVFIYLILIFVVGEIYSRMAYKRWLEVQEVKKGKAEIEEFKKARPNIRKIAHLAPVETR